MEGRCFGRSSSGKNWNGGVGRGMNKIYSIYVWNFHRINLKYFKRQMASYNFEYNNW